MVNHFPEARRLHPVRMSREYVTKGGVRLNCRLREFRSFWDLLNLLQNIYSALTQGIGIHARLEG
jgi:hypothetical protein